MALGCLKKTSAEDDKGRPLMRPHDAQKDEDCCFH